MPHTTATSTAWHHRIDETLDLLKDDPAPVIRFALDHVEPFMVRDFMEDWQDDHDAGETARVRHWLEMMRDSLLYGQAA